MERSTRFSSAVRGAANTGFRDDTKIEATNPGINPHEQELRDNLTFLAVFVEFEKLMGKLARL
ncbi:MAG: hypothetical protein Tsb009_30040 [Planctomycetaceae bacterium]